MKRIGFFILPCLLSFLPMKGQSYYDDDIYYDPSKEKETPEIVITEHDNTPSYTITYSSTNDSWSDSWTDDVDEYNRRGGIYAVSDTLTVSPAEKFGMSFRI